MVPINGQRGNAERLTPEQTCNASLEQRVSVFRLNEVLRNETNPSIGQSSQNSGSRPNSDAKTQICFDFTKNQCARGATCKFSHDLDLIIQVNSQEKGICFDFLKGTCTRGPLCRFSHDLSNLNSSPFQSAVMQSASCPTLPCQRKSSSICYDFVKNQCSRGDACRYSHDIASILYNKRPGPSTGKNPHVMCLDFSRGRCMRGDSCKYVHAPIYEPIRQILPPPSPPPSFYNSGEHQVTGDPVPFQEQSAEHYAALLRMLESVRVEQASAASPCPASPFPLAHHPPRNDLQEPGSVPSNYGVPTCRSLDALAVPFYHNHGGGGDGLPLPLPKTSTASVKLSPHLLYGSPHHGLDSPTIPASWGGNTESTPMQTQKENHGNPYGGMMQGGMPQQPDLPTAAAGCAINNGGRGGDQMIKLETLKSIWSQK